MCCSEMRVRVSCQLEAVMVKYVSLVYVHEALPPGFSQASSCLVSLLLAVVWFAGQLKCIINVELQNDVFDMKVLSTRDYGIVLLHARFHTNGLDS